MSRDERGDRESPRADERPPLDMLPLAEALGREVLRDPDGPLWRDQRYVDWLFARAREDDRAERRLPDDAALAHGEAFMARALARQLGVSRAGLSPRPAAVVGCVGEVVEHAAARNAAPLIDLGVAAGVGRELWDEPVEQWVELPIGLPAGRYAALRISGESMAPLMHTGDTVLVKLGPALARDTVVIARHPDDGYVCKRVHRVRRDRVELASVAADGPSIVIPRDPRLIVGTVLLVSPAERAARRS